MVKSSIIITITSIVAILFLFTFFGSYEIVDPGRAGVYVYLGEVQPEVRYEGWNWKVPWASDIKEVNIQTVKFSRESSVFTKDIQNARIEYTVNYELKAEEVPKLYSKVGMEFENKLITPRLENAVKNVIGKWNAGDLVGNREKAIREIDSLIRYTFLNNEYFNIYGFQLVNIDYEDSFENAVNAKVVAEQRALEATNKTKQIQEEASQKIISAEAEAKAMEIKTKALEKSATLIQYEIATRWNGVLPTTVMGNSIPLLNIK